MLDLLTLILSDHRCPHCLESLRFRWVRRRLIPVTPGQGAALTTSCAHCPNCGGAIESDWHPAVIDDWMWGKRLAPGLAIWLVAMVAGFHPVLMLAGTLALVAGLFAVMHYMVAQRWRRPYYRKFDPAQDSSARAIA